MERSWAPGTPTNTSDQHGKRKGEDSHRNGVQNARHHARIYPHFTSQLLMLTLALHLTSLEVGLNMSAFYGAPVFSLVTQTMLNRIRAAFLLLAWFPQTPFAFVANWWGSLKGFTIFGLNRSFCPEKVDFRMVEQSGCQECRSSQSTALNVRGPGFYSPNSEENLPRSKKLKIKKNNKINKILKRKEKKQAGRWLLLKERRERRVGSKAAKGTLKAAPSLGRLLFAVPGPGRAAPLLMSSQRVLMRH